MKNFGEAYRGLMENITVPVMTPKDVLDADSRIRQKRKMIYKRFSYAFAAVFLVLCCFAGATGYFIMSKRPAGQNGGSDAVTLDMAPDQGGSELLLAAFIEAEDIPAGGTMPLQENENTSMDGNISMDEEKSTDEEISTDEKISEEERFFAEETAIMNCDDELTAIEYSSREEFLTNSGFAVALPPEEKMGGYLTEEEYQVLGGSSLLVRIASGDRQFELNQTYAGVARGNLTQKQKEVIAEDLGKEDVYTTAQGFTYTIEAVERYEASIRVTISIEGYELSVGFTGFTKEEAFAILETMDLTVYQEKK